MDEVEDVGQPSEKKLEKSFSDFLSLGGSDKKAPNDKRSKAKT